MAFRLWLWRLAMLATTILALFFAATAVGPFTTVGEPVFDTVILRARWWQDYGFALVQLGGAGLWAIAAITAGAWARGFKALAAGITLFICLIAMASEYDSLIQFGALRDPATVAAHKLMVSRGITLTLALVSLALGWWARPKP